MQVGAGTAWVAMGLSCQPAHQLPGHGELAEQLWKSKPSLKIIIMSGYSVDMVKRGMPVAAGYTFLAKPFTLEALADTVRQSLEEAGPNGSGESPPPNPPGVLETISNGR